MDPRTQCCHNPNCTERGVVGGGNIVIHSRAERRYQCWQCGTTGAAEMAQAAGVKKLILSHMGPHLSSHGPLEKGIGDVRRDSGGEIMFAEELLAFDV